MACDMASSSLGDRRGFRLWSRRGPDSKIGRYNGQKTTAVAIRNAGDSTVLSRGSERKTGDRHAQTDQMVEDHRRGKTHGDEPPNWHAFANAAVSRRSESRASRSSRA